MNIYAKFQLHPPYGFWEDDFWIYFPENLAFRWPWQPIKINDLDKIHVSALSHLWLLRRKFQLYPPYGFWGDDLFSIFFYKFNLSVAMATDQIERFEQKCYVW